MDLDLRLVRAFLVVAEEEHVGRAARRLYVSQPALSKQIRRLEGQIGVDLLERIGRNVRPTAAGRALAAEGAALLQRSERMVGVVRQVARSQQGAVRIGFVPPLPIEISTLIGSVPNPVELHRVDWVSQADVLLDGTVDLCLVPLPVEAAFLEHHVVWAEPRVAGFGADHPLAARDMISITELSDEPIVDLPSNRDFWGVNPRPDGREPLWGPLVTSVEEMLEVVASGRAMCITGSSVAEFYRRPGVVFVPLTGVSASEMAVVWLPGELGTAAAAVRDELIAPH